MKEKNGGFTLIELMIALAVLSIMSGVLLQSFVVSRRLNTKAGKEEQLLNAAKQTMEELKGYPLGELEKFLEDTDPDYDTGEDSDVMGSVSEKGIHAERDAGRVSAADKKIKIGNTVYRLERLEDIPPESDSSQQARRGYRLITEYGKNPSGDGKAPYIICAEADYEAYNSAEDETLNQSYSINQYKMPNIADVSSFQNAVIDPLTLIKDDAMLTAQLLLKVNPDEEEEEENEESGSSEEASAVEIYDELDISRRLMISINGTTEEGGDGNGILTVQAQTVYTVDAPETEHPDAELTIEANLALIRKNIVKEEGEERPANRVYLFLPDENTRYTTATEEVGEGQPYEASGFPGYEMIRIQYLLEEPIEFFLVAASPDQYEGILRDSVVTTEAAKDSELLIYSNIGDREPVSYSEAKNRLYHLSVRVYEAIADSAGEEEGEMSMGREVLRLDSTKSE